eukprot:15791-Alexandrium_andersonii.AAC.1
MLSAGFCYDDKCRASRVPLGANSGAPSCLESIGKAPHDQELPSSSNFGTTRHCSEHVRAVVGAAGYFRGTFGQCRATPET